jgi:hypothetical protein
MPRAVDSRRWFLRPFYESEQGRIIDLASPREHLRDGQAVTQFARCFPPEMLGIEIEPASPDVPPAQNVIFVGRVAAFLESLNHLYFGERIQRILDGACYVFEGQDASTRCIRNSVTGQLYVPHQEDSELDFGILYRHFQPSQNTVVVHGAHRQGTAGAAIVGVNPIYLDQVYKALEELPNYDDSLPLEILVEAKFASRGKNGLFSPSNIDVRILTIVYNRYQVYDMARGGGWKDQRPWDFELWVEKDEPARPAPRSDDPPPVPRLELHADLRGADPELRDLCSALLGGDPLLPIPVQDASRASQLLEKLTVAPDLFQIQIYQEMGPGSPLPVKPLPEGTPGVTKDTRKQFLVHLILCRVLGLQFDCKPESIRRYFPLFRPGTRAEKLVSPFRVYVRGRMYNGFEPLLGTAKKRKDYVRIATEAERQGYGLQLRRIPVLLKFRV